MKAIVYRQNGLPISDENALYELDVAKPQPGARDLLVKIHAIAVNPVDTKVRLGAPTDNPRILGWDAVGVVEAVGDEVSLFQPGDEVFYAGDITRAGSYAEYGLVDERIAGHKPRTLSDADAAALPLTSLTAWELLFDRLEVQPEDNAALLIVGAGGGVGSILTQLARKLTALTVIGTASRPETAEWITALGAHHVVNHQQSLSEQLAAIGHPQVRYVASLTHTDSYYPQLIDVLAPQGKLALIDDPETLDVVPLKRKAISLHWELMFTRSLFQTEDMLRQHQILQQVSQLIDDQTLQTTAGEHHGIINAANLRKAHALIESGHARGKIVLSGF